MPSWTQVLFIFPLLSAEHSPDPRWRCSGSDCDVKETFPSRNCTRHDLISVHVYSQLVTPEMMCEMQCLREAGISTSITYDDPEATRCRDYCRQHAYDFILSMLASLTTPTK